VGMRNGKTTVVQAVSLKAPLDVAMGRAALVEARVADATQAMFRDHLPTIEAVAVPDAADVHQQPSTASCLAYSRQKPKLRY